MKKLLLLAILAIGCDSTTEPTPQTYEKWGSWVSPSSGFPRKYDLHLHLDSNANGVQIRVAYIGNNMPAPAGDTLGVFTPLVTYTAANGRYRLQWSDTLTVGSYGIDSSRYDISVWHNSLTDRLDKGGAWMEYSRTSSDSIQRNWIDGFHRVLPVNTVEVTDPNDTPNSSTTYRCLGTTQAGSRCKRNVKGAFYCWQHA